METLNKENFIELNSPLSTLFVFFAILTANIQVHAKENLNIINFGAVGDGKRLNTESIQKAIDVCSEKGGGRVVVPKGVFLSGSIQLKSHVELFFEKGAVLLGSKELKDYLPPGKSLVFANRQKDISIVAEEYAEGIIDGNGKYFNQNYLKAKKADKKAGTSEYRPTKFLRFFHCENVTLRNMLLRNSPSWTVCPVGCKNISIVRCKIRNEANHEISPNTDGIDPVGNSGVLISECDIETGDDAVVIKNSSEMNNKNTEKDILVENCTLATGCNAIKIGTETQFDIQDVIFRNIKVVPTKESNPPNIRPAACIGLMTSDGANIKNVTISNVTAEETENGIFVYLNARLRGGKTKPGTIDNIHIENVSIKDCGRESAIMGIPNCPVGKVTIKNIDFTYTGTVERSKFEGPKKNGEYRLIPERIADYPQLNNHGAMPAWGFYLRHVKGPVVFDNIKMKCATQDKRPCIVYDAHTVEEVYFTNSPDLDVCMRYDFNAASMTVSKGSVKSLPKISHIGKAVYLEEKGSCDLVFDGKTGIYNIGVSYFDEVDGKNKMGLYCNNSLIKEWNTDLQGGKGAPSTDNAAYGIAENISVKNGDKLSLVVEKREGKDDSLIDGIVFLSVK